MSSSRIPWRGIVFALALAGILAQARVTHAGKAKQPSYYFLVYDIKLADDHPAEVEKYVRDELNRAIAAHPRLLEALPEDAPDPVTDPKPFARYIEKKKIVPFRVDVEVVSYEEEVEELEAPRRGQMLTVRLEVKLFGESLPKHTFGFTGEGSATIKMEVGKKVRKADRRASHTDAAAGAAGDALTTALMRLDEKTKSKGKRKRGKRRKK